VFCISNCISKLYFIECGKTLQKQSGIISNPGFPSVSRILNKCEWRIFTNPGEVIVLNVKRFEVMSGTSCETDYVEIRDGYHSKSKLIGKYCRGRKPPKEITSTGNRLLVKTRMKGRFFFSYKGKLKT
jgi:hypothetical protein